MYLIKQALKGVNNLYIYIYMLHPILNQHEKERMFYLSVAWRWRTGLRCWPGDSTRRSGRPCSLQCWRMPWWLWEAEWDETEPQWVIISSAQSERSSHTDTLLMLWHELLDCSCSKTHPTHRHIPTNCVCTHTHTRFTPLSTAGSNRNTGTWCITSSKFFPPFFYDDVTTMKIIKLLLTSLLHILFS